LSSDLGYFASDVPLDRLRSPFWSKPRTVRRGTLMDGTNCTTVLAKAELLAAVDKTIPLMVSGESGLSGALLHQAHAIAFSAHQLRMRKTSWPATSP
jgi:hypothetical protein